MYALVHLGNGKYYGSTVFGFYKDHPDSLYSNYYVVFNPEKTCLWKWYALQQNTKYLIPKIDIVDCDKSGWIENEDGVGGVDFLPKETADSIIESGSIPDNILKKCLEIENSYVYDEYAGIKAKQDRESLGWARGGFHDARSKELKESDEGLYLKFDGIWGCTVEVWFWGDVSYDTESRDPDYYDPYWFGATVILQDGFVYLVDEEDLTVEKIEKGYCWFKARHMKYHIIPN